jgi:hypothetical protein
MTDLLRRAGRARLPDGRHLLWTVAEGTRGRRWRATVDGPDGLGLALLLELDVTARLTRLELAASAGLLTLHPDAGGTRLHGNIATPDGMRHIDLVWADDRDIQVEDVPIALAVIAHRYRERVAIGERLTLGLLSIGEGLEMHETEAILVRDGADRWSLERGGRTTRLQVDGRGILAVGTDVAEWPLEE